MNKNKSLALTFMAGFLLLHSSCKEESGPASQDGVTSYQNGIMILNEGAFFSGNASLSWKRLPDGIFIEDVFSKVNNRPLGDVAQSVIQSGQHLYIAVNNSQKVEVIDRFSGRSVATITGISSPRFSLLVNPQKIYITDWGTNSVKIINPATYEITGSIPAGNGPEQLILVNEKVFVVNIGGFGVDSTLTVINPASDQVITTLRVGLCPNSLVSDANSDVWVLCNGSLGDDWLDPADDRHGSLYRINSSTLDVETHFDFAASEHPLKITINKAKNELYYLMSSSNYDGYVYRFKTNAAALPAVPLIDKSFYALGVDPLSENIYCGYSPAFNQQGYMFRYSKNGTLIDSLKVGVGPNSFFFNY